MVMMVQSLFTVHMGVVRLSNIVYYLHNDITNELQQLLPSRCC